MRRLLPRTLLLFAALALVAFVQSPRPSPLPQTPTPSLAPDFSQSEIQKVLDVQRWRDTTKWNDVIAWNDAATTTTQPQEGNVRAQAEQEAVQLDGDRFDRLAMCESTMDRYAVGGGIHLSYFQWRIETWHAAGGTGDPRDSDYATQKAIAMEWATVANPYTQWPQCWPRSA